MRARHVLQRSQLLAACTLSLLGMCGRPAARAQDRSTESSRTFEQVWRTVRDHFYDPAMHGIDWQAAATRYRAQAEAARDPRQLAAVINRMLGELHASHLGYYTPDDFEFYFLPSVFSGPQTAEPCDQIGVMGVTRDGAYQVSAVLEAGPAARAGLWGGDRVIDAGGRPFTTVGAFRGRAGQPVKLTVDRPGHGRMALTVTPTRLTPRQAFLDATRKSVRVIQRDSTRIGYVHLWCMTDRAFAEELESALLGALAETDGLVLDLRDGFGGRPFGYTAPFFTPDVIWEDRPRRPRGGSGPEARHTAYDRPVVVLINGGTRSAKEFVAYQFSKSRRGTLMGTTTAGAFLGAGGFPIGKVGYLEVPIDDITLDGIRLEGRGVKPNVAVPDAGSYTPADPQIERAVSSLLTRAERSPAAGRARTRAQLR